jgi:hypothetical protein
VFGRRDQRTADGAEAGGAEERSGEQPVATGHRAPVTPISLRDAIDDRIDDGAGLGDGERNTFTGQGVDVTAGVTHEQHPARDR